LAADSTGFSTRRYETWLGLRKGRGVKRGWLKLHVVVALESLAILSLAVTRGTRHDSPLLKRLFKPIPRGGGDFLADSAYLSRGNCDLAAEKGRRPFIRPKKNTNARSRGSAAWREMVAFYRGDGEAFMARYHGRSRAESVWSVLKGVYGNSLSSKRTRMQRRELHLRTIAYNIGIVNLTEVSRALEQASGTQPGGGCQLKPLPMLCRAVKGSIHLATLSSVLWNGKLL